MAEPGILQYKSYGDGVCEGEPAPFPRGALSSMEVWKLCPIKVWKYSVQICILWCIFTAIKSLVLPAFWVYWRVILKISYWFYAHRTGNLEVHVYGEVHILPQSSVAWLSLRKLQKTAKLTQTVKCLWLISIAFKEQEALLWQRDSATRLSVEILQLQKIPFEN